MMMRKSMVLLLVVTCGLAGKPTHPDHVHPAKYNLGLHFQVTDIVNMTVVTGKHRGSFSIALFGKTTPKAVENFKALCDGRYGCGYVNSTFHRVLHNFIVQGGDFQFNNGTGGYSIYNKGRFEAENYIIPHAEGSVAMAAESKTRLGSQFYILVERDFQFLNGKHVVFGQVTEGFKTTVQLISRLPTKKDDSPRHRVTVVDCTVLPYVETNHKKNHRLYEDEDGDGSGRLEGPRKVTAAPEKPKSNDHKDTVKKSMARTPDDGQQRETEKKLEKKRRAEEKKVALEEALRKRNSNKPHAPAE